LILNTTLLLIPFLAFLAAELVHASGVIAVVIAGLSMTQTGPRASIAESRQQTLGFWSLVTFVLNGALFVLIGIEAQTAVRAVESEEVWPLLLLTFAAWIALRLALLERKRVVMIAMRDRHAISDTALLTMQSRLDREELRLTQPDILE